MPTPGAFLLELYRSALLLCSIVMLASPLAAQTRVTASAIAGIDLPLESNNWSADPDGSKAATLDLAAALAGSDCEAREAHAWSAADQTAAESVRTRTEAAFETAGWLLQPVSRTSEGQHILLGRRGTDRFVMVWRPEENEIGLLLCRIESAPPPFPGAPDEMAAAPTSPPEPAPAATPEERVPPDAPDGSGRIEETVGPAARSPAAASEPPAVVEEPATQGMAGDSSANIWLRLLAVGLLILGGIGLIVRDFRARAESVEWRWPTASATVERGWVEEDERDDASGVPVKTYMPMLRYRYRVDGEEFQGGAIGLDDRPLPSADAALRLLSCYPDFATVKVRYDPDDPSFAVIEALRPPPGREFYFGLGAIVLALAALAAHLR